MAALAIIQLIGLGDFGPDVEINGGMGRVPFTIWLACLLMVFAGVRFSIQSLAEGQLGAPVYSLLAGAHLAP